MRLRPKKRLGQSFLFDKNIQRKIVSLCEFKTSDLVVEIGAGTGEMTRLIAGNAKKVYAIEIDPLLCRLARENLKNSPNVEIINKDILKFDFKKYFKGCKVKVVGNIPYYISSPIIEYLFKFKDNISEIFITVQKEFARRMVAGCGSKEYGSFSCFAQYYAETKILLNIKKSCFFPVPKVDSSLVRLRIREKPALRLKDERLFFEIIRKAFNQRRKTLKNSLQRVISKERLEEFFSKHSIDPNTRPERLSLRDFANLSNI